MNGADEPLVGDATGEAGGGTPSAERGLEGRLGRLEKIVASLETDDLDLERALALFEEGITHVRAAERILAEVELRVEELLGEGGAAGGANGAEG